LFGERAELPALGRIGEVCGYDPSPAVRSLTLAAFRPDPVTNTEQSFGIVASGDFDQARLASCAMKLVESRGGTPERKRAGSMTLVRDRAAHGAEVALLDEGMVLVSSHEQLRSMLQALDGRAPSVKGNPTHQRVRRALGAGAHGLATLELRPGWLEQLFGNEDVSSSPLSELDAAGVRLELGDPILLEALFSCRTPEACARLEEFFGDLRNKLGPAFERQGLGFLGKAALERRGSEVRAKWKLDVATLSRLGQSLGRPLAPQASPKEPAFEPEESIPAKP
jgi:hypothetical protein